MVIITNSTEIFKKKLTAIGKSKRPICLRGIDFENLPVPYLNGPNALMNADLFTGILIEFDKEINSKIKNVLLLLDNESHRFNAAYH